MTPEAINDLVRQKAVPHPTGKLELLETHISWVLLADHYAYKIKKPLKLSFLDFSDPDKRQLNCQREVVLNRRLAPDMYLGVLSVARTQTGHRILEPEAASKGANAPADYAVWMKRMDRSRQLDILLREDGVARSEMEALARLVAAFHKKTAVVGESEDWRALESEFRDLQSVLPTLSGLLEPPMARKVRLMLANCGRWLRARSARIESRKEAGFVRDGHGDLHCRNVFMTRPPVVFDCIEFSEALRTLDVLSEIGFLCMDLERLGRPDLSEVFCSAYNREFPCMPDATDPELFLFYKMYRANVRLKVEVLALDSGPKPDATEDPEIPKLRNTARLMLDYAQELGLLTA